MKIRITTLATLSAFTASFFLFAVNEEFSFGFLISCMTSVYTYIISYLLEIATENKYITIPNPYAKRKKRDELFRKMHKAQNEAELDALIKEEEEL